MNGVEQAKKDLAVVVERIANVKETIEKNHEENKDEHKVIIAKQDFTNGKVRNLQVWKGSIVGAIGVLVVLSGYFINDYISNRDVLIEHSTRDTANSVIIEQNTKSIEELRKSIENLHRVP